MITIESTWREIVESNRGRDIAAAVKRGDLQEAGQQLIEAVLDRGIKGGGPFKGADAIAEEAIKNTQGDPEAAIARVVLMHTRLVGATGFATGLGGLATLPITVPTDVTVFYTQAARMVGAIAKLRGYDPDSDDVRSAIAVSLIGVLGSEAVNKIGVDIAGKAGVAALKKVPGKVLIKINQKVGFRLVTKFGEKGVINLVKVVPVVASGVGATVNVVGMRTIAGYAKSNFPTAGAPDPNNT